MTRIAEIRFNFSENTSGCVMVRSIFVSMDTPIPEAEQSKSGAVYIIVALVGVLIVGVITTTLLKKYKNLGD